jgi:SAM-dependent MidA family methyltransferase
MEAALYHPEHGYYASGRAAIGRQGDFFTSVSVGPLFGRLLARQFIEMWERLEKPSPFTIVEQGAHDGTLASDVLAALSDYSPGCYDALAYVIVEPLAALRAKQERALASYPQVTWASSLEALAPCCGVFFSNELLDAFPFHVVRWSAANEAWSEMLVDWHTDQFVWTTGPLSSADLSERLARLTHPLPDGYTTEIRIEPDHWITQCADRLQQGWLLAIDYGYPREEYFRPERINGTRSGYAQHRRVDDLLAAPGACDLTAHVEFTSLIETAAACGFTLTAFTDQHRFAAGLARLHFPDTDEMTPQRERDLRAFKTLMHPEMLGAAFKVVCFEKDVPAAAPLSGFAFSGRSTI